MRALKDEPDDELQIWGSSKLLWSIRASVSYKDSWPSAKATKKPPYLL